MKPILYAIGILLGIGLFFYGVLSALGMESWFPGIAYINVSPTDLAQWAVQERRSAHECSKLHFIDPLFRPTIAELRSSCYYEYAEAAQDPLACKQLLPDEYALACITNLLPKEVNATATLRSCNFSKNVTSCFSKGKYGEPDVILRYEYCDSYKDSENRDTCLLGETINGGGSCLLIESDLIKNHCLYESALQSLDAKKCQSITNDRKDICIELVDILTKYPSLRSSSYLTW